MAKTKPRAYARSRFEDTNPDTDFVQGGEAWGGPSCADLESLHAKGRRVAVEWFEAASFVVTLRRSFEQCNLTEQGEEREPNEKNQMKMKYQIAAIATSALLAGCSQNDAMVNQKQPQGSSTTNEPRETAGVLTNAPPAPPAPSSQNPAVAPAPQTPLATVPTNVPLASTSTNSGPLEPK